MLEADKRKTIVKEIEHWRRSKLLPEHYCDFLLNLYRDPDQSSESNEKNDSGSSLLGASSSSPIRWKIWLGVWGSVLLFSLILLNFNSFQFPLQICISVGFILILYIMGIVKKEKNPIVSYGCFGAGSVALLLIGMYLLQWHALDSEANVYGFLVFCSIVWLIIGIGGRLAIFHFCGWIGALLLYGWSLYDHLDSYGWFTVQFSWLPIGFLFGWMGWLFHQNSKSVGKVLLLIAFLIWFAPELFLLFAEGYGQMVQVSFVGKMIIEGIVLFVYRKKWIAWVSK